MSDDLVGKLVYNRKLGVIGRIVKYTKDPDYDYNGEATYTIIVTDGSFIGYGKSYEWGNYEAGKLEVIG